MKSLLPFKYSFGKILFLFLLFIYLCFSAFSGIGS
jgi:hypothetical protein